MNFGWYAPDHVTGPDCCRAAIKINPFVGFFLLLSPLLELTYF